jgi:hypothetical protein
VIRCETARLFWVTRQLVLSILVLALSVGAIAPALLPVAARAQDTAQDSDPAGTPDEALDAAAAAPAAQTQTVVLPARQDAYITSAFPNGNFGSTQNLNLGWQLGGQEAMRILVQFDLSAIPRNAVINSARWEMFQNQVIPVGDRNMDFRAQFLTQGWSETGVTWNNANFLGGDALPLGSVPGTIGLQSGDARGVLQAWLSGAQQNFGVLITGDEIPQNGRWRVFRARETGDGPRLVVNFTANCDNVPPTAVVEQLPQFSPGEFRVFWNGQDFAPSGCQPTGIANFDVQYRINGGDWIQWRTRTESTNFGFRNLAPNGAQVEFRARATDRAGNVGQYTSVPQATTRIDSEAPVAFMNELPPVQTASSFVVSWSGSDNLSGIAFYDVEFRLNNGVWQSLVSNTTATSFQVTGAQAGQTYGFRVRATDRAGNVQPWSQTPQAETTILDFPVVLLAPISPNVIQPGLPVTSTIELSWRGLAAPGTTIQQFNVYYSFNNGPSLLWRTFNSSTTGALFPWTQFGLGDGVYTFDVTAVNNLGQETNRNSPLAQYGRGQAIVDMADTIRPQIYMEYISGN